MEGQTMQPTGDRGSMSLNPWMIASGVLGLALLASLAFNPFSGAASTSAASVDPQQAGTEIVDFLNKVFGAQVGTATLEKVGEEHGLYKIDIMVTDAQGQAAPQVVFLTTDGKLFIPQAINVDEVRAQYEAFTQGGGAVPGGEAVPAEPTPAEPAPADAEALTE